MRALLRFAMLILVVAQTAPSNPSSITGIVARAGTAEALDQAVVSLIPSTNIGAPPNVETDAAGRFTFRNIPAGRYTIRVRREGYFGPLVHGTSQPFVSRPITLNEGQSIPDVHIDLIPGATVSGRVFDERGVPAPGADVSAVRITYDYGRRFLSLVRRRADERGEYRLYWLPPGEYYIRADLAPQMASGKDGMSRTTYFPNTPDVDTAQPIVLAGGAERTALDIGLRTTPAATIRGKIIGGLSNTQSGGFSLVPQDPDIPFDAAASQASSMNVGTGDFEIRGVRQGSYELVVRANNSRGVAGEGHVPVEVGSADVNDLIVALHPGVEVKIRLLMEGGTNIDLRTLEFFLDQRERGLYRLRPSLPIDSSGVVTFSNVPPSLWVPVIEGPYPDAYISDMRQRGKSVFNDGVIRVETEPESLELIVHPKGPAIDGIVRGAAHSGMDTTRVVLVPQPPRRKNILLYQVTNPDSAGHFRFTGVAPGEYKVFAWESVPANAWGNSAFMGPFEGLGRLISVNAGDLASITVDLIGANQR